MNNPQTQELKVHEWSYGDPSTAACSLIHPINDEILMYTPRNSGSAHPAWLDRAKINVEKFKLTQVIEHIPTPQLTMPTWIHFSPGAGWTNNGPPLSPY
jgi:hypothetical protein